MKQLAINSKSASAVKTAAGFSLIELLVVIAIIALLAAIIFPVFATVRENGRQQTSLSNMHDISTKLEQYKLDHKSYPPVLFGYAFPNGNGGTYVAMDQAYAAAQAYDVANPPASGAAGAVDTYFPGLYPEYVRDVNSFKDGNNPITDLTKAQAVNTIVMTPTAAGANATTAATAGVVSKNFYTADAYDSSPQVTGTNQVGSTMICRYSPSWTDITLGGSAPTGSGLSDDLYTRQLRWQNPPSSTYVTSTTYHVRYANKVLVLFQNGTAKNYDASIFLKTGPDQDIAPVASGAAAAKFWEMTP